MHYYEVVPNQIVRQDSTSLTYASDVPLAIGQIVSIPVGKKSLHGIIVSRVAEPTYATKPVGPIIEATPLPGPLVGLAQWLSTYYSTHPSVVLQTILPRGIAKSRRSLPQKLPPQALRKRTHFVFTNEQQAALETIRKSSPGSILIHGVTGSGKTAVYIAAAEDAVRAGKSTIILVPEIALTSQLVDQFSQHFDDIILTHSRQTEAERHLAWRDALTSTRPRVVVGPRSALFLPLTNVGLIVIDEAHEPSFKQEQSPRYSALRAASILAREHKAKLILGSATPSVADYYLASASNRPIITMTKPARADTTKPDVTLIDLTKRSHFKHHRFLSDTLIATLSETFAAGKQALIFHNRRGTTASTLCSNCGWVAADPETFVPLTLHADQHVLRSHLTGKTWPVPTHCPECGGADIIHKGIGTKLIESELRKLFPQQIIARFDGDTTADGTVEKRYSELYSGTIDLIIGTQVIAKGLDLPPLRTVGVVQADSGLALPDYGASERVFQLLAQVVGRVGRSQHPTKVIVQSYQPTHPAVVDGLGQDYQHFYQHTLAERRQAGFPPFRYLLKLTTTYKTEAAAVRNAQQLARTLRQHLPHDVKILGPTPAFYERVRDTYRWQIVLQSPKRQYLVDALAHLPPTHWQFELDPISLL